MARLSHGLMAFSVAAAFAAHFAWAGEPEDVQIIIRPPTETFNLPPSEKIGEISFDCRHDKSGRCTLSQFMDYAHVCALLVVKAGKIRLERYRKKIEGDPKCRSDLGENNKDKKYGIASVTKSLTSTLLGLAIARKRKAVTPADFEAIVAEPVEKFIPQLRKSGYAGKPLERILRMRSGVPWDEEEDGKKSDTLVKFKPQDKTIVEFAQMYRGDRSKRFNYSGLDANINGAIAQSLLGGEKLPQYLQDTLWKEIGAAAEGRWKVDREGTGFGACCFYLTVHDLARFGHLVLNRGTNLLGKRVMPSAWFELATIRGSRRSDDIPWTNPSYNRKCRLGAFAYKYQWWLLPKRTDFTAVGKNGQFLHIYPDADAFIVQISDWGNWGNGDFLQCETFAAHDALVRALR